MLLLLPVHCLIVDYDSDCPNCNCNCNCNCNRTCNITSVHSPLLVESNDACTHDTILETFHRLDSYYYTP